LTQAIPHELRNKVISEYLKGKSRNEIARHLGLGAGTVTSIIQEWRQRVAEYEPDQIRELALELRKAGITADDCVRRTRIINKIRDLDIDEDKFLKVIEDIQVKSIEKGVPPEMCGELLSQLFNLSQQENLCLDEIPNHLRKKLNEIKTIEDLLTKNRVSAENINSYLSLKESLAEIGIHEIDIEGIINMVRSFKTQGLDATRIVQIASSIIPLEDREEVIRKQLNNLQNSVSNWNHLIPLLQTVKDVSRGSMTPSVLQMLINCVNYRAAVDKVPTEVAAQRVIIEIEQLHTIQGFDRELLEKKLQIQSLENRREQLNESWTKDLQAIETLVHLNKQGVTRDHIHVFNTFFWGNQSRISLVSLISDLDKYGNLKTALGGVDEEIKNKKQYHDNLVVRNNELWQQQVGLQKDINSTKIKLDSARKEASHRPSGKESSASNPVDSRAKSTTNATPTTKSVEESRKDNQAKQDSALTN
jgi:hypothetical protein